MHPHKGLSLLLLAPLLLAAACSARPTGTGPTATPLELETLPSLPPAPLQPGERLRAVATTTLVGDVVAQVAGQAVDLTVLLPPGADPHSFQPTPQDLKAIANAHVIFISGFGLETFLQETLQNAGGQAVAVSLSVGIQPLTYASEASDHGGADPHVWLDPQNVIRWAQNAEWALSALDPDHASLYRENSLRYQHRLQQLDSWIQQQVASIPPRQRLLVTDHRALGYFAQRYGFIVVATVVPGYSTIAEPSAQELAQLEGLVQEVKASALFVGVDINPALAERVAQDTGLRVVPLYIGSLSGPEGPAPNYIALMQYDVRAIMENLAR